MHLCVCVFLPSYPYAPLLGLGEGETHPFITLSLTLATTLPSTQVSGPASATHTEAPTSMLLLRLLLE